MIMIYFLMYSEGIFFRFWKWFEIYGNYVFCMVESLFMFIDDVYFCFFLFYWVLNVVFVDEKECWKNCICMWYIKLYDIGWI